MTASPTRRAQPLHYAAALLFALQASMGAAAAVPPAAPAVPVLQAPVDARALLARLYAMQPGSLWPADRPDRARLALRLLRQAPEHGLDPARYDVDGLERRLAGLRPQDAADFERALSAAMLQYLGELNVGRVPSRYRQGAGGGFDPVAALRLALDEGGLEQAVEAALPPVPLYGRVKAALARYQTLAQAAPSWPVLPRATRTRAGEPYAGAALLGERLRLLGDLGPGAAEMGDGIYTLALAAGVRRFQARHGLADDGVLGPDTLAALSVPLTRRVTQLALTLERLRWLPPMNSPRVVAVNVPTYRLWAFEARDGYASPVLEMRVIVGTAVRTPTPLFIGEMRHLEFNPYWNVPPSIQAAEIVPKLARNPAYLQQNDMEVVGASGRPLQLDASAAVSALRTGSVRVRQRPGAHNALGELKFAMPNPMNIYLHSTSSKELFGRNRRDLSHGCIRVEQPVELAEFVLADPRRWDAAGIAAAIADGTNRTVRLARTVPVILFYATALADRDGQVLFAEDIYRQDEALVRTLGQP